MRANGTRIVYESHTFTPLKLDLEPENGWLEDKFCCGMAVFWGYVILNFGGVRHWRNSLWDTTNVTCKKCNVRISHDGSMGLVYLPT